MTIKSFNYNFIKNDRNCNPFETNLFGSTPEILLGDICLIQGKQVICLIISDNGRYEAKSLFSRVHENMDKRGSTIRLQDVGSLLFHVIDHDANDFSL